ncbi:MAG: DUF5004 domain-containing protein [Gelidibacter sp.]
MKNSNFIIKSLMGIAVLFMVSCNSDDSISCPADLTGALNATETEFSGTWIFSGMMADDAIDLTEDKTDNPSKDIFSQYTACDRDLAYDFMTDRKYSLKQGSLAVDCNNKESLAGTWSLTADNALTFVANCASQTTKIVMGEEGDTFSYSSTLTFRDVSGLTKSTKVTFTYTKEGQEETPQ